MARREKTKKEGAKEEEKDECKMQLKWKWAPFSGTIRLPN